jgi:uncharacterized protein (TIGR02996 family)
MTDAAFVTAICAEPDDDTPRLAYADWLEERGDAGDLAQSEFIHVQIELAGDVPAERRRVLRRRERELLAANEAAWRTGLPALDGIQWEDFQRGFLTGVRARSVPMFFHHAAAFSAAAPIQAVRFAGLSLVGLQNLASSEELLRLRMLFLGEHRLGDTGAATLARSLQTVRLTELFLSGNDITDSGVQLLASSPYLAGLSELDLRDNEIGDGGAQALAWTPWRPRLRTLWLVNNHVGDAGAEALASVAWPRLRHLYLNHNHIGDAGVAALASAPALAGLVELDLRHNRITDAGAAALAGSPYLMHLEYLDLSGNPLGVGARALRRRFGRLVWV